MDRQSFFDIRIVISNKNGVWNNVISLRINRAAKGAGWHLFYVKQKITSVGFRMEISVENFKFGPFGQTH